MKINKLLQKKANPDVTVTDEEMKQFANAWQQRQGSGVRLAVLKSFWDEETVSLNTLNESLTSTYHLDVTKNYQLDANRRVVIERAQEEPSAVTPAVFSEPPPVSPANP